MTVAEAEAQFSNGMAQARNGDFAAAAASFRAAAEADPADSRAHNNLGSALAALGRHDEAVEAFRAAIALDPDYAQAHFNLGASLQLLGGHDEAFACFRRTIELEPRHEEAYYFLGREHQAEGRLNEALACYLQAAQLSPDEADIHSAMAGLLVRMRQPAAAARALEKLLSLNPADDTTRVHLMDQLAHDCDWDRLEPLLASAPALGVTGAAVPPFGMLAFDDDPERNLIRSRKFAETFPAVEPLPAPARPSARPERLKIGYFSADFHDHATMFLAARLFELHDRDRFAVHAFSYGDRDDGAMRQRALEAFDVFHDVRDLGSRAIAELASGEGIDIAIDLKGYTEFHRIGIFASRPAPVQMTWLGYPGTLAAPFIDYMIADKVVVPDEHRDAYAERLIYLPGSYQPNDDRRALPPAAGTRASAGLPDEGFVFCCFNYSYKLSRRAFTIWMELLRQVEGSVLWLLECPGNMQANLRREMTRAGVDPQRLIIAPRMDLQAHLARLQHADLFLDTFNYNAHTTASDALWVGVPVVTKSGKGFAARVAASLLGAVGLDELVTDTERDYAELALSLAKDSERLSALRARLEAGRETAPLFDSTRFTRHFEAGLDRAYDLYLEGRPPADIVIGGGPEQ